MSLVSTHIPTPLGDMLAVASPEGLCLLEFVGQGGVERELAQVEAARGGPAVAGSSPILAQAARELDEYFAGRRRQFCVPLDLVGTPFQRSVWQALLDIPWGETRSYAEQSRAIGRPTAMRAVAAANGNNKVSIIVPCHRVIGSNGTLTGYGGGVQRKRALLALEGRDEASWQALYQAPCSPALRVAPVGGARERPAAAP
ncbi:methylated-DNA--[protein]-cysteine S-methyltransferase [Melaminivora alkalimesophila]|uniref:Methylated-DNA--protein-cysteine methyltransferase n=1 Tax=Melaminivora alkalimesophila TaxID=1165852 RepID=A0A317RBD8_9BURK|nr:methylated-DNA--[protein]-cysteine S-methyltransferase [Melaminivora alkalimesophila]PWW46259.1 methylated-DNA-[protein]-cysteine S-methyltransferase [Melaminivora alkalimesophila]